MNKKRIFQYGQNDNGFILPTVFGFILISSTFLFLQGLSCVVQIYGLKAEVNNLYELNYAINVKRVIDNLEQGKACGFQQPLVYSAGSQNLNIKTNCVYVGKDKVAMPEEVQDLVEADEISGSQLATVDSYIKGAKPIEKAGKVSIEYNGQSYEYRFDKRYSILEIEYGDANAVKVIAVNADGEIEMNKNVK